MDIQIARIIANLKDMPELELKVVALHRDCQATGTPPTNQQVGAAVSELVAVRDDTQSLTHRLSTLSAVPTAVDGFAL